MHVRESTVRRGAKTYRYLQLVQSYRRADGKPAHEVIASFKFESEIQAENLRIFARAQRESIELALGPASSIAALPDRPVAANLRYLDLAVLRHVWRESGLHDVLRSVLPSGAETVANAEVLEALILHRCVDPGSKLSAVRWFPGTALPELVGIHPDQFNNSRLHRALEALDKANEALQSRLAPHLQAKEGHFVALFMDGTDTWFEGSGPDLASRGRTKDGAFRQKIVIVALCDQRGLPLRWCTLPGARSEIHGMAELWDELGRCPWVGTAPVVADRAMGSASSVERLSAGGTRFVVAVREPEIRSWVPDLAGLPAKAHDAAALADALQKQAFERIDDRTWYLDAGVLPKEVPTDDHSPPTANMSDAVRTARAMKAEGGSLTAMARRAGCSVAHVRRHLSLLKLSADLLDRVCAGEADGVPLRHLVNVAESGDADAQRIAFEAVILRPATKAHPRRLVTSASPPPTRVRGVVYFNPDMFVQQRESAAETLSEFETALAATNRNAWATPKRYGAKKLQAIVGRELARRNLLDAFDIQVVESDDAPLQVVAVLDEKEWARRRSLDGYSLLLAHPAIDLPAPDLIQLYRDKNAIEMDFRTVKSALELRPIFHFTDAKVRAHVTICVLALLLCRLLEQRMGAALHLTAPAAIETLASCHLNQLIVDGRGRLTYTTTRTNPEQERLLTALRLRHLVDDDTVRSAITPR